MGTQTTNPTPTSVAQIQAIAAYPAPISAMNLYQEFDRPGYLAKFGVQPPDEDPSKPYKLWFATDNPGVLKAWTKDPNTGAVSYGPIFGDFDNSAVNIPGFRSYPAWVNSANTPAFRLFQGLLQPVSGSTLVSQADAQELATEVNGTLVDGNSEGWSGQVYVWNGETRRPWQITINGVGHAAANLAAIRWMNGVGSPGSWDVTDPTNPRWVPSPAKQAGSNPAPHVPVPQRDIHAGEQVVAAGLFGVLEVELTQSSAGSSSSGDLSDIRARLTNIESIVGQILLNQQGKG